VFFLFPKKEREEELLASYHAEDTAGERATSAGDAAPSLA
jgi:hypothetical protein